MRQERYIQLIEAILARSEGVFVPQVEDEATVQVERGLVLPLAMGGAEASTIEPVIDPLLRRGAGNARVVDAARQARPHYPALLVYAWRRARELWPDLIPAVTDEWRTRLQTTGDVVASAWSNLARGTEVTAVELPSGGNPETRWYEELVLLDALARHAYLTGDTNALAAIDRAALYHMNETQPDHATAEPWGLLAFIHNRDTHSVADQMLHTVQVHQPAGPRGVTRILLADTLHCLRGEAGKHRG